MTAGEGRLRALAFVRGMSKAEYDDMSAMLLTDDPAELIELILGLGQIVVVLAELTVENIRQHSPERAPASGAALLDLLTDEEVLLQAGDGGDDRG